MELLFCTAFLFVSDDIYLSPNETSVRNDISIMERAKWPEGGEVSWSSMSMAVQIFLPFGMLALIWGRRELLFKFLHQFEKTRVSGKTFEIIILSVKQPFSTP